jgi:hypothetical protein
VRDPGPGARPPITALEARSHVIQLQAERMLARSEGLAGVTRYMSDLEEELDYRMTLFTAAAVGEIAMLRGELFGRQEG